jgi:hypothetical protein
MSLGATEQGKVHMFTVDLARALPDIKDRVPPRVDWDKIHAEYVQRSRVEAMEAASMTGSGKDDRVAQPG